MSRQVVVTTLVAIVVSASIGFMLGQATNPTPANATRAETSANSNRAVLRAIKKLDSQADSYNRGLTSRIGSVQTDTGSIRPDVEAIRKSSLGACRFAAQAAGGFATGNC